MRPVRLNPSFRERVWGSTRLEPLYPNSAVKIGEVWFEGAADSPLLIKFIFTTEKLSVQVHPGDEYARLHHNSRGKTEMWHILAAEPGAKIAAGFRAELSGEDLIQAAKSGEIEDLLCWFDASPGDTFLIPAGTVHAIGAGLTLCEIQQNSDVTYRLYDYGRPRELHLDHAAKVSRRTAHDARCAVGGDVLASCDYFVTRRRAIRGAGEVHNPENGFLIIIEGACEIAGMRFKSGEVCSIEPGTIPVSGNVSLLHASLPGNPPSNN